MKICFTSQGNSLDAALDPRFGRAQYFVIVDPETLQYEALTNPAVNASGGAGVQAAQILSSQNIDLLVTGHLGPNAVDALARTSIKIALKNGGTIREALLQYKSGELKPEASLTAVGFQGGRGRGRRNSHL